MVIPERDDRMSRLRDLERRFKKFGKLQVWRDSFKRRFYLYYNGHPVQELSFSEVEFRTSKPEREVTIWRQKMARNKSEDLDETNTDGCVATDGALDYLCNELEKYGLEGSGSGKVNGMVVPG
jgi:hypothetical protein